MKKIILIAIAFCNLLFASFDIQKLEDNCEKGNGKACMDLASYYRVGFASYGIKKDDSKAKLYYDKYYKLANSNDIKDLIKQCDYGLANVCKYLAYCYRDGKNVQKNRDKEIEYYKKSCELGNLSMCDKIPASEDMAEYFNATLRLTNSNEVYKRLKKICHNGYAKACNYLFQKYKVDGNEKEASKYLIKTKNLMDKNCNKKDAESCEWMWNFYIYTKQTEKAKEYFEKAKKLYKKDCDSTGSSCLSYQLLLKMLISM